MTIEGQIVNVMETWPLQLTVRAGTSAFHVRLGEQTAVTRGGAPIDAGRLRPADRVRVTGRPAAADAASLVADSVEVLG